MDQTDSKIQKLKECFPNADSDVLLEVLISCNGSFSQAESILSESFPNHRKRKNQPLYQASIKQMLSSSIPTKAVNMSNKANNKTVKLFTKEDIETTLSPYVTFEKSFLPPELSDKLLTHLLKNKKLCTPNEFYLFGQKCTSSHSTALFVSSDKTDHYQSLTYNAKQMNTHLYNDDLTIAQLLIEDKVHSLQNGRAKLPYETLGWKGDYTLVNMYENGANKLDWHSDRLSHIGPHNTIASLSLGATREFKLRKIHGKETAIYSIFLPHNTLLVMHPGCQEEFKHSVQATNSPVQSHGISGATRVNLTYRYFPEKFMPDKLPQCGCGLSMLLRRSFKDVETRGRYFWSCEGVYGNHDCGMFHWADFTKESMIADKYDDCSFWIADDDFEKKKYLESILQCDATELHTKKQRLNEAGEGAE